MITIKIKGLDRLERNLANLNGEAPKILARALMAEGEMIMLDSKANWVPVDTGALRSTGHVQEPVINGTKVSVTLGYGGPAVPYAVVQHERLDYNHTVGRAKYLEGPTLQSASNMDQRLADRVKRDLENAAR